jgi:threonine dehydrogenase-like Zn-dependent dehydrogenase
VTGFSNHFYADIDPVLWGMSGTSAKTNPDSVHLNYFDCVISTTNSWPDWKLALQLSRRGGTIVTVGFPGRGQKIPDFNPLASQYLYDKQLTITSCGHVPNADVAPFDIRFTLNRNCEFLMQAIINGSLPAVDLIEDIRLAADLGQIYEDMMTQRKSGRTFVLDWQKGKI